MKKQFPLILIVLITMFAVATIWLLPRTEIDSFLVNPVDIYKAVSRTRAIITIQIMIFGAALFWIVGRKHTT